MSLDIRHINVIYRDGNHSILALEDVSMEIKPGQCFALVGESGSGKTTLGKACLGLLPGNAERQGHIFLDGQKIDFSDEAALNGIRWKRLAMVFQDGAVNLNPVHRIVDQVAEPIIQHERLRRNEALDRASLYLEQIGLSKEYHGRYPHQLSGGQIQQVLLAMAMILDPGVIILDEPTSALDAMNKGIVAEIIRKARDQQKAVLLITHDLEFASYNADTVAVIYLGQIMETLPAEEMLSNPMHPYTLALGKSYPTMNATRDLGGIRGDAFFRIVHRHGHLDETHGPHSHTQAIKSIHENGHAPPSGCLFHDRCTQAIEKCKKITIAIEEVENHMVRCLRRGIVNMLELKGVAKNYGQVVAIQSMDLTVKSGELLALVGETGSGKTTLAMISAGVLKPDQGGRQFDGRDMDQWMKKEYKAISRRIGVIYQNPAESISHRFSVYEAVAEPLKIHGVGKDRAERTGLVKSVLADVHLSTDKSFLVRYSHELSMGTLQRVCLARALVLNPSMLIADEPTSSLDPSVQAKVLKLLLDLQIERGLTMLFISHDIGLVRKISDRIGVMLQGRLVELGQASTILTRPAHPYTRLLVESVGGKWESRLKNTLNVVSRESCPFSSRCPKRQDLCNRKDPPLFKVDQRLVACHFPF